MVSKLPVGRRPPGSDPSARKLRAVAHRVLVVGGGVIGLSCAWRLAEAGGHEVTLVAPDPGRDGASWVAAGMLAPVTEVQFGEAPLTELLLEGAAGWKEFAASLERASGHDVGYDQSGTLTVALDASDRAALDQLLAYQHSLGCTAHRRTASECRALVPSLTPTLCGGIEVPGDHHVDNRALLGALVAACRATGVRSWRADGPHAVRRRTGAWRPFRREPARLRSRPPGGRRRYPAHRRSRGGRPARDPAGQGPHPAAGPADGGGRTGRRPATGCGPATPPHRASPGARAFDLPRPPTRQDAGGRGHHGGARGRPDRAGRRGARIAQRRPGRRPRRSTSSSCSRPEAGLRPATPGQHPGRRVDRPARRGRGQRPLPQRHAPGAPRPRPRWSTCSPWRRRWLAAPMNELVVTRERGPHDRAARAARSPTSWPACSTGPSPRASRWRSTAGRDPPLGMVHHPGSARGTDRDRYRGGRLVGNLSG